MKRRSASPGSPPPGTPPGSASPGTPPSGSSPPGTSRPAPSPLLIPAGLIDALRGARVVTVLTGAGVSAESGVATFREPGGLWETSDPQKVASPEGFRQDPAGVWQWYAARRREMAAAVPNPGHLALVTLEQHVPEFTLVTQNIDGLHQRAGSRRVVTLHGDIGRARCCREDEVVFQSAEVAALEAAGDVPPRCPNCGAMLRPDVVWFGEPLPTESINSAWRAAEACDVFLSVGTAAEVEPAASLPLVALESGALLVEVNIAPTVLTFHADHVLAAPAGKALPALVGVAWGEAAVRRT